MVLGVKCGEGHDAGAALVWGEGGETRCVAMSEERLSRVKHDGSFPARAVAACLAHVGVELGDVDLVCLDRLGEGTSTLGHVFAEELEAGALGEAERELIAAAGCGCVVNHHAAHAASAFGVTRWGDAAALVIDGSGTRFPLGAGERGLIAMGDSSAGAEFPMRHYGRSAETQSVYRCARGVGGRVRLERAASSRRSGIGHFYTFFSRHVLGFGPHQEGKAMGLAAYGDAARAAGLPAFPESCFKGIDTPLLEWCMEHGFRPARRAEGVDPTDPDCAAVALWMQETLSRGVLALARRALGETGSRRLCLAGGTALNVVANRLVRDTLTAEGLLDELFVQPAASDTGTPIGAALYGRHVVLDDGSAVPPFQENIVYLGPGHDEAAAQREVFARGARVSEDLPGEVAGLLLDGKIVGWWQGRSEIGPRALGARSILCWPRPAWMKDHLNARVKHREMFRPFAPIIEEERAHEVFDCGFPVPYMLINTMVREAYRDRLPAVTHADGSGRLQTVARDRTPRLHELLGAVRERDGVGVLLNTSFNDSGEPIVETAGDALACFEGTNIDALVVGRAVLVKSG